MELFDFAPLLGIPAVVKVVDAYRQLVLERDWRKFGFTAGSWVLGVGLALLVSQTSIDLPDMTWADLVLVGIGLGSTASVVNDFARRGDVAPVNLVTNLSTTSASESETEPPGI